MRDIGDAVGLVIYKKIKKKMMINGGTSLGANGGSLITKCLIFTILLTNANFMYVQLTTIETLITEFIGELAASACAGAEFGSWCSPKRPPSSQGWSEFLVPAYLLLPS